MKHMVLTGLLGAAILAGAGLVNAQDHKGHHGPRFDFDEVDANADGQLTRDELMAHQKARFQRFDSNGDGLVSADEMRASMRAEANAKIDARITKMMERQDANKDGFIGDDEIKPRGAGRMFKKIDADGDGMISRAEFDAMQQMRAERMKDKG
jgi:Ca2+-binding EF-hand superfamily protein